MKNILFFLLGFLPFTLNGQEVKCCKSKQQVEKFITGTWEIEDSNSDRQYHFYFKDGQGNLEYIEPAENDVVATINEANHSFIDIIESDGAFTLKITDPYGERTADLKQLSGNKMILCLEGKQLKYIRLPH